MKKCFAIALTAAVALIATNNTFASPVSGTYNPATGEITVSIVDSNGWIVESTAGAVMTGDAPINLPSAGGLVTDSDIRIGESNLGVFSYDITLGNVAQTGLPDDGTLRIFWSDGLGLPTQDAALEFVGGGGGNPPTAAIGSDRGNPAFWDVLLQGSNITFNTTGTSDGGAPPLSYEWDWTYDAGDGFQPEAGETGDTSTINDLYGTIGLNGTYTAAVRVTNSEGFDIATMEYTYIPEPTSMALAGMGLIGFVATRRRR